MARLCPYAAEPSVKASSSRQEQTWWRLDFSSQDG
eukprot:CAMPEP_0182842652 /NCGR_PEP_ID=MMETSP0006_2-20121128/25747_1 /TAXON_ID=97485 /ORGANISM="Prymnesium parvum, Strain Texoma1" /LENGTH=34 /DNA_ID= /DNA_START= /DNA_END= /DNA_ORIENTATION=